MPEIRDNSNINNGRRESMDSNPCLQRLNLPLKETVMHYVTVVPISSHERKRLKEIELDYDSWWLG